MKLSTAALPALFLASGLALADPGVELRPRLVDTALPTTDLVIANLVLEAIDGEADASSRIQDAIDRVAAVGGGVVFLAGGTYPIRQPLLLREGVTLRGDWAPPQEGVRGTILAVDERAGSVEAAATTLSMQRGTGVRELTIWHPRQSAVDVLSYPWALGTTGEMGGNNTTVMNVTLVNAYRGIRIGPEWNELHTIRHVFMTALDTGFSTDTTTDIGRIDGLVIGPGVWEGSGLPGSPVDGTARRSLRQRLRESATGVDIGRSDWEYIHGIRAEGLQTGIRFRAGQRGTSNAVMLDCVFRDCVAAIRLEHLNGIGLSATACLFAGSDAALVAAPSFSTVAQFNTCRFEGAQAVRLEGNGLLSFQNCDFAAMVDARAGALSMQDCRFADTVPHLLLGAEVTRARLLGCRFAGQPDIRSEAVRGDVVLAPLSTRPERLEYAPPVRPPPRGPRGRSVFSVLDGGASPELPDNTPAFQAVLEQARQNGGGTVMVPAGFYRFAGSLRVPAGVELRGCFDVPHHTVSGGSVLMPLGGRGEEDGRPFLELESEAGLRGITVWHPEQDVAAPVPYPWSVRSLGPRCWLQDVTLGNSWQGADFWTHPSDGHVIRYLAGACLRRGLWVSKSDAAGWVEDVQFNPHYAHRLHASLPRPATKADFGKVIDFQREHLDAMVFGRCAEEHIFATFLYAAYDGLAFRDDGGGANARVLIHGTDTASRALVLEAAGERGLLFINAQLVPLGNWVQSAILAEPGFNGKARLFNSQVWAGPSTAVLRGGAVLLQQMNTLSGPIEIGGGSVDMQNITFGRDLAPHVTVHGQAAATLTGNLNAAGVWRWTAAETAQVTAFANSASPTRGLPETPDEAARFATGFEADDMPALQDTIADTAGGRRGIADATCRVVEVGDAPEGRRALRLEGRTAADDYAFCYFRIVDGPFPIFPDTVLRYWVKPLDDGGRHVGIDAAFAGGKPLRDRGVGSRRGVAAHPSPPKGEVGQWLQLEYPLGALAGESILFLMAAYDARNRSGPFAALFDGIELHSEMAATPWRVTVEPSPGSLPPGTALRLRGDAAGMRYTLDGSNPSADSPLYVAPIPLPSGRPVELRVAAQGADGKVSSVVHSAVYEVQDR